MGQIQIALTYICDTWSCIWQLPQHRAQRSADQSFLNPASTFFSGSDILSSISHIHNLYFLYVDNSDFLSKIEAISTIIHTSAPFMFSWQQRALWSPETPSQIQFNLRFLYERRVCPFTPELTGQKSLIEISQNQNIMTCYELAFDDSIDPDPIKLPLQKN